MKRESRSISVERWCQAFASSVWGHASKVKRSLDKTSVVGVKRFGEGGCTAWSAIYARETG